MEQISKLELGQGTVLKFVLYVISKFMILLGCLLCKASSKWAFIDLTKNSITRIPEDVITLYKPEEKSVFEETDIPKIKSPETTDVPSFSFHVQRKDIDVNQHMHNLYYLDYAYEALPQAVYELPEANYFEIMYKTGCTLR